VSAMSVAWGRLFFLYGPGEKRGRLVSDAICSLCSGRPFPASEGHQRRDFMHIEDAARALAALLMSEVRGAVNIASGEAVSIRFLLERIMCETGRPDLIQFGALKSATNEPEVIEAAVGRLRREVGFAPQISLSEGVAQTVEWWREKMRAETEITKRRQPRDGFT
jgi:nucleoside-diphosphate-sugar epimerase